MYDSIIIGCGPAGMTSALYLLRAGKKVLVLESLTYGGQIVNTPMVDNYPGVAHISGLDFAENLYNQIIEQGAEVVYDEALSISKDEIFTVKCESNEYKSKTVIIATGVQNRHLGLPNEEDITGCGVSYCALCDGAFFKGKDVCVNGGGNTALEDALVLSVYCNKIYLLHRRDTFRAEDALVKKVLTTDNIVPIYNANITELKSTDGELSGIKYKTDKEVKELQVEGLFIAIGQTPKSNIEINGLTKNESGYIDSIDCTTSIDGLFVAGDIRTKEVRQLTTAVSDGTLASVLVQKYLQNN